MTAPARSGAFRWTLGALARHRRQHLHARVVGVVGSNGKTTTKELIRTALAPKYRVHATEGNHSNPIGVPLTVLSAPDDTQVLVVEMGTNEPGEIGLLSGIARPNAAAITARVHRIFIGANRGIFEG